MSIENVISFVYVNRLNSFQKAAEALYITQPSLSSRIKSLEKDLGVQLFIRKKRGVDLTEHGKLFLPIALQMFDLYLQAQYTLHQNEKSLVIGSITSVATSVLPNVIYMFRQKNPYVSVRVITSKTTTTLERLLNGECNFAITEKIEHPDIDYVPIHKDPISLMAAASHPFVNNDSPVSLADIAVEPLICFNHSRPYWKDIEDRFQQQYLKPNVLFNVDSIEAAKAVISKGIALSFLPELSLEMELSRGELCRVNITPPLNLYRDIYLIYRKNQSNPHMDFFIYNAQQVIRTLYG